MTHLPTRREALALIAAASFALPASAETMTLPRLLERKRIGYTVPRTGKAILVNIPSYELIAFQDGYTMFRSRVIVGTPVSPTPILQTATSVVRFRPTWRPTPDMVASGEYEDRVWPAGPKNPLGLAAVRFQPGMLVYLHDTNRRDLFARRGRAMSHGCVRVEAWDKLVAWLLGISMKSVHAYANGGRTFDHPMRPVPVTLGYYRRFPDPEGRILLHPDIYRLG